MGKKRRVISNPKFRRKNSNHPAFKAYAATQVEETAVEPTIKASELQTISAEPAIEAPIVEKIATPTTTAAEKKPAASETPTLETQTKTVSKTKTTARSTKTRTPRRKAAETKSIS